ELGGVAGGREGKAPPPPPAGMPRMLVGRAEEPRSRRPRVDQADLERLAGCRISSPLEPEMIARRKVEGRVELAPHLGVVVRRRLQQVVPELESRVGRT